MLAYHVIWGCYGFWLPNDPRGSWSEFVYAWELFRFGGSATKTDTRHSVAGKSHNSSMRQQTKSNLKSPPVILGEKHIECVAEGFRRITEKSGYKVFACAILPEHVHLVLGRHEYKAESMMRLLKAEASTALQENGLHPMQAWPMDGGRLHSPWADRRWIVYLDSVDDIERAVTYVEENPAKEGRPRRHWPFVVTYHRFV